MGNFTLSCPQHSRNPARPASFAAILIVSFLVASSAYAGQVIIEKCNPGSTARVFWNDGIGTNGTTTTDLNGDGDMNDIGEVVTIPNQEDVVEVHVQKELGWDDQGEPITTYGEHLLQPQTLAFAEPFSVPSWNPMPTPPGTRLASVVDVLAFKHSGVAFHTGQVLNVTNGSIAQTSSIVFKDAATMTDPLQLFNPTYRNSLPNFTGSITVGDRTIFRTATLSVDGIRDELLSFEVRPNPLLGRGDLYFVLARRSEVDLTIFDLGGRAVRTLSSGLQDSGTHGASWDGNDDRGKRVPSGLYLARLRTASGSFIRRIAYVN